MRYIKSIIVGLALCATTAAYSIALPIQETPTEVIAKLFLRIKSRPDSVTFCVKIFPLL
jgi:hypothetical protein